jgi:hypothetical protein
MNPLPPPRTRPKRWSPWLIAVLGTATLVGIPFAIFATIKFIAPHAVGVMDNQFGDQHLKTTVALIELHKVRFGKYPDRLLDLKFTGEWDQIALQSVRYYPNSDRTSYYIEVENGWIGKPDLKMPEEFWRGTGYDARLKPSR